MGVTSSRGGWGWDVDIRTRAVEPTTRRSWLAVNIVIYALTQEGSITQRLMQMVH